MAIQKLLPGKQTLWFGLVLDPHTVGAANVVQCTPDLLGLVPINAQVSRKAVGLQKWETNRDSEVAGLLADESVATNAASLHASLNRQE